MPSRKAANGGKGKMKDKSTAKEKTEETRECWVCGKIGHLSTECWYREDAATPPKVVKSPGKAKGQQKGKYKNVQEVQTGDDASYVSSAGPSASTASTTRQQMQPPGLQAHIGTLGMPELDDGGKGDWICGVTWEHMPIKQEGFTTADGSESTWILVDSGAACHVCPRDWMPKADTCMQTGLDLKTVSGERM